MTLKIEEVFTKDTTDLYNNGINWVNKDAAIKDADGKIIFEMKDVEAPQEWSQLAVNIAASKYFRKAGLNTKSGQENSIQDLIYRIADSIRYQGILQNYFNKEEGIIFYRELVWLLLHQYGAFNSPVWFNVGLYEAYEIKGGKANYAWNFHDGEEEDFPAVEDSYKRPQGSACFIQEVKDSIEDIFKLCANEANIFKYGSGSGSNMSNLRGKNEKLSGGGYSSGLISFLKVLDSAAGAIKSGGKNRRSAVLRCLDADHPEILDFINWKVKEEEKALALIEEGYSSDFNGEAYATVSGQNSNNSVRLTDEFMRAVENDTHWDTINRTDGKINKTYKAREIFYAICEAAWKCADPGVQFDTTINNWNTCVESGTINASNPCGEYSFLDATSCNLASLNLVKFSDENGFNFERFQQAARIFFIAQDILVDHCSYPTKEIAHNSHYFRPLGLGYANLGGLLMRKGIPYDSDKGRSMAASITAIMSGTAYRTSAEMAEKLEPFKEYKKNRNHVLRVLYKHQAAVDFIEHYNDKELIEFKLQASKIWEQTNIKTALWGIRNSQATLLAPTGTIGLLMDCDTTGIEPEFALVKSKLLAGGGTIQIVNQSVDDALDNLAYFNDTIVRIIKYIKQYGTIEGCPDIKDEHLPIFDCAVASREGKRYISPEGHVNMVAAVQPFLSGGISKTINIPNESTVEDIADLYTSAWKKGIKSITVYRDGCKFSQPLNTKKEKEENRLVTIDINKNHSKASKIIEEQLEKIKTDLAKKPEQFPKERTGRTWELIVGGTKIFLRSGEYPDGRLGEIFVDLGYKEGSSVRSLMNQFAISISFCLQNGVALDKLVDKFIFTKFEPHGLVQGHVLLKSATSLVDAIFRVLGHHYLGRTDFLQIQPENEKFDIQKKEDKTTTVEETPCSNCGNNRFIKTGTCYVCMTCGTSQGCS